MQMGSFSKSVDKIISKFEPEYVCIVTSAVQSFPLKSGKVSELMYSSKQNVLELYFKYEKS